jgi:metallo-beta-lactamase family protein
MRIQFFGAARTVTGSCHLVEVNNKRILLDCGLFQGKRDESRRLNEWMPVGCKDIDALVLSHGHLDHCGKLPVLTSRGNYTGPIYCTDATQGVATAVLNDSAGIQEEDAAFLNRRSREPGQPEFRPLYTQQDVNQLRKQFKHAHYNKRVDLGNDVGFTLFDAGHILGSSFVWIDYKSAGKTRNLLFTADVGRFNTPIIGDPQPVPGPADIIITESTYGGRQHKAMTDVEPHLLALAKEIIEKRSRLLVPSFAVGRTQTMLWYFAKFQREGKIPPIKVYVDSPMGVELTHVYEQAPAYYDAQTRNLIGKQDLFGVGNVKLTASVQQSKEINADRGPCVIIASSPTCEFGRILHHLVQSIEKPNDIVLFVGWTPPHTLGRRLQDGEKRVRIYDRFYDVKVSVRTLPGMSGHADGNELVNFLKPALTPQTQAYVVHGEPEQAGIFARRLVRECGVASAVVPAAESEVFDAPIEDEVVASDGKNVNTDE